ncbi:MAG: hypothetical protein ACT4QC_01695 [Planctomycetaceae bacterium]
MSAPATPCQVQVFHSYGPNRASTDCGTLIFRKLPFDENEVEVIPCGADRILETLTPVWMAIADELVAGNRNGSYLNFVWRVVE